MAKKKEPEIIKSCTVCQKYFDCSISTAVVENKRRDTKLLKKAMAEEMKLIATDCSRFLLHETASLFKKDENGISGIQKKKDYEDLQYGLKF